VSSTKTNRSTYQAQQDLTRDRRVAAKRLPPVVEPLCAAANDLLDVGRARALPPGPPASSRWISAQRSSHSCSALTSTVRSPAFAMASM
jgi:hypothetical protein